MFTGRDEQVRYEQNQDAYRQAEAHRMAKELPKPGRRSSFLSNAFAWMGSRISRFRTPLDTKHQVPEIKREENQSDIGFTQSEPIAAQE